MFCFCRLLLLKKKSFEEEKLFVKEKYDMQRAALEDMIGFTNVMKILSDSVRSAGCL